MDEREVNLFNADEVNENELAEVNFNVLSVVPPTITTNIKEFKAVVIPKVKQYANLAVTKDNYKEIKKVLANINKSSKQINDYKKSVKEQASAPIIEFENDVKEIIEVYNEVIKPLKDNIKFFEEQERELQKAQMMSEMQKALDKYVEDGQLSKNYADQFVFDDNWLKSGATKKGVQDGFNQKVLQLIEKEKADKQVYESNITAINLALTNAIQNCGVDLTIDSKVYVDMFEMGVNMPFILNQVNKDVNRMASDIKSQLDKQREQIKEEVKEEVKTEMAKPVETVSIEDMIQAKTKPLTSENVVEPTLQQQIYERKRTPHINQKTGEVYAYSYTDKIVVKLQENPTKDKIYKYTYEFEGDAGVIKTLNFVMKTLSAINKTFKYNRN